MKKKNNEGKVKVNIFGCGKIIEYSKYFVNFFFVIYWMW